MKLSERTLEILKNFAGYEKSILIEPGNIIRSLTQSGNVICHAKIAEEFDREVCIAELNRFLGTMSLFNEPDLQFEDKFMVLREGSSKCTYRYANRAAIQPAPYTDIDKMLKIGEPDIKFTITSTQLSTLLRASSVLELPEIRLTAKNGTLSVAAVNKKDKDSSNVHEIIIGETDQEKEMFLDANNLRFLPVDYEVHIHEFIAVFRGGDGDIAYYVAPNA
jgi:hypothetical protein